MGRVVVSAHLTLDGVMQAPGQPDEDTRGGFRHGGWQRPYSDQVMGTFIAERMGSGAMLLGRKTYENFAAFWPQQPEDNPIASVMNGYRKYVASTTLQEPLTWTTRRFLRAMRWTPWRSSRHRRTRISAWSEVAAGSLPYATRPRGRVRHPSASAGPGERRSPLRA